MHVTIATILEIPLIKLARPQILGGEDLLSRRVRWLHTPDLLDLRGYLKGDELILSSGMEFTRSVAAAKEHFVLLRESGASGLIVSFIGDNPIGRQVLHDAAPGAPLPVILVDELQFVELTEIVHRMLLTEGGYEFDHVRILGELTRELSIDGVTPQGILERASKALLAPIIYEDRQHRVIAYASSGISVDLLLKDWSRRSTQHSNGQVDRRNVEDGWMSVPHVEAGGPAGRLVIPLRCQSPIVDEVLQLARHALEQHFTTPDALQVSARSAAGVFEHLRRSETHEEISAMIRGEAGGFHSNQNTIPVAVRLADEGATGTPSERVFLNSIYNSALETGTPVLAGVVAKNTFGILFKVPTETDQDELIFRILNSAELRVQKVSWWGVIGVAAPALLELATRGIDDAHEIARMAPSLNLAPGLYHLSSQTILLRRLLRQLSDAPPVREFVELMLQGLSGKDPMLLEFTKRYLELNGNIAELSRVLFLSRPSIYARVRQIEGVLGLPLSDVDVRLSLHLALTVKAFH